MTSIKEPKFFNNFNRHATSEFQGKGFKKIKTLDQYLALFQRATNEIAIGEASPSYIFDKDCHSLIKEVLPKAKIIAIIRQPVKRAYSNFLHARRAEQEVEIDFEKAFTEGDNILQKGTKKHFYFWCNGNGKLYRR